MSRAFVSERDGEAADEAPAERPQSPHPNYVTPGGLAALRRQADALRAEPVAADPSGEAGSTPAEARSRKLRERDLRWISARIASAIRVDPRGQPRGEVRFGARVTAADEDGVVLVVRIVGEDEADAAAGRVSWVSPLARALTGAAVGDEVAWHRPAGDKVLTVMRIEYGES
jgi:transcription elongation GreA/GreB family factor